MKNSTMKTIIKHAPEAGLRFAEKPIPTLLPNDILIKVKYSSICGTDLHIYKWDKWAQGVIKPSLTIGHEFEGHIVEVGSAVTAYKVGQRVSAEGHLTCNVCRNCRTGKAHICEHTQGIGVNIDGAFAQYIKVPASNIIVLPDFVPEGVGAILDPLGNAVHTTLSFDMVGEDVLITGAGPIGIMAVAIAKKAGARRICITDINPYRLELAKKVGAHFAINVNEEDLADVAKNVIKLSEGFDVGLEMSGAPSAINTHIKHLRPGSPISLLGIPSSNNIEVDWSAFIFKGLSIKGIYCRQMYDTWYKMLSLIDSGLDMSQIITHTFDADDFQSAFDTMLSGKAGKVLLKWY